MLGMLATLAPCGRKQICATCALHRRSATYGSFALLARYGLKRTWVIRGMRRTLATLATLAMTVTCAAMRTMAANALCASFVINQSMATCAICLTIAKCRTMVTCASTLAPCSLLRISWLADTAAAG
jgi:hypothetical protein